MNKHLWMAVTPDELELPMAVADTARELTAMLGLRHNMVAKMYCMTNKGQIKGHYKYKIVKVEV